MKKVGLVGLAVCLSLSWAAMAGATSVSKQGKAPDGPATAAPDKDKARPQGRGQMDPAAQQKRVNEQLATLKTEHQAAMAELQAIKQLAVKEKATQTAAALDKLMAGREQEYQKKVEPLQQRLKGFQDAQKGQSKGPEKSADKALKSGEKQVQKDDAAKTKTNK
ncbi:MAG: hypothetical protein FJ280_25040 [Planctomycetes bacterium]|nr:hypothetical protein [Planctomycetota bacterium]